MGAANLKVTRRVSGLQGCARRDMASGRASRQAEGWRFVQGVIRYNREAEESIMIAEEEREEDTRLGVRRSKICEAIMRSTGLPGGIYRRRSLQRIAVKHSIVAPAPAAVVLASRRVKQRTSQ